MNAIRPQVLVKLNCAEGFQDSEQLVVIVGTAKEVFFPEDLHRFRLKVKKKIVGDKISTDHRRKHTPYTPQIETIVVKFVPHQQFGCLVIS
jgi:hypothetical protein